MLTQVSLSKKLGKETFSVLALSLDLDTVQESFCGGFFFFVHGENWYKTAWVDFIHPPPLQRWNKAVRKIGCLCKRTSYKACVPILRRSRQGSRPDGFHGPALWPWSPFHFSRFISPHLSCLWMESDCPAQGFSGTSRFPSHGKVFKANLMARLATVTLPPSFASSPTPMVPRASYLQGALKQYCVFGGGYFCPPLFGIGKVIFLRLCVCVCVWFASSISCIRKGRKPFFLKKTQINPAVLD